MRKGTEGGCGEKKGREEEEKWERGWKVYNEDEDQWVVFFFQAEDGIRDISV